MVGNQANRASERPAMQNRYSVYCQSSPNVWTYQGSFQTLSDAEASALYYQAQGYDTEVASDSYAMLDE